MNRFKLVIAAILISTAIAVSVGIIPSWAEPSSDPLPSWNDTETKQRIIRFIESVTNPEKKSFVKPEERIAVFDNDGTLWSEQPMYFQLAFVMDRIKKLSSRHPEWKNQQPYKAALEGDVHAIAAGGEKALIALLMATHAETTTTEFEGIVKRWFDTARHPKFKRPYTDLVFQPMLEVLACLRANGFKTYIVSGGGIEFMRPMTENVYGIPPEQVVGSTIKVKYELIDGTPVLKRLPEVNFIDDKAGKPVGIHYHIGRRPIIAFGNSDGDFEMLEWTTTENKNALGVIIHHDDAGREFAYDRESHIGRLNRGLDESPKRGWLLVSMKKDWQCVYPYQKK